MVLTALSSCVLSLPVTPSQLENEDVKVMKCIVEALADVLSRQHHVPVGQDCLETLKTDDRLVTILRHRNFLKELQDIAVRGDQERTQLQKNAETPTTTQSLQIPDEAADRSMLEALGGPGERSILAQRKRDESVEEAEEDVKRMEEESEEKRANSGEDLEEGEGKGGEKRDAPRNKSKEKRVNGEEEEEDKRSAHKQEEEEMKRGSIESLRRWTKRTKAFQVKKNEVQQHEVPHHSKELTEEEEQEEEEQKKKKRGVNHRSPEEKELQMIARRPPEERRAMEEEGSASRKSEDPEIESLAAIESELENVAQKLHELRRG